MRAEPPWITRAHIAGSAVAAGALSFIMGVGGSGFGDSDPYRHLRYARELWESGFTLRGHPFLPYTLLGTSGVDLWWGFHLLLVPFTFLGFVRGAHLAATAIAAASAGGMAWVMARFGQSRPAAFALLPLLTSSSFAYRGHVARPAYLTIPLVFMALAAGVGRLRPVAAGIGAFVHGALHLSSPLSPVFAGFGALARGRAGWREGAKAVLASVAGLLVCFAVRPDRAHYLQVAWTMSTLSLGWSTEGRLPAGGGEGFPMPTGEWLLASSCSFAALGLALWAGRGKARAGDEAAQRAALLALALALVLSLRARKFLDYYLPALALAAAVYWPREGLLAPTLRRAIALAAGLALSKVSWEIPRTWYLNVKNMGPTEGYIRFAKTVHANVPQGSMLFVNDWSLSSVLYGFLPEYRYPLAYDPSLLYGASPPLFWTWLHAVFNGAYCPKRDLATCTDTAPGASGVAQAVRAFDSEWVVTVTLTAPCELIDVLKRSPETFEQVATQSGGRETLTLWHLKPSLPPRG